MKFSSCFWFRKVRLRDSRLGLGFAASVCLVAMAGVAQQPVSAPGMGSVTGHVTCGDTERPARFAMVMLFGVPKALTPPPDPNAKQDDAQMAAAIKAAMESMSGMNMVQTETGMDGSFAAANVAPGIITSSRQCRGMCSRAAWCRRRWMRARS